MPGGLEVFDGKTVVVSSVADTVEGLDESTCIAGGFVFDNTGDDGEDVIAGGVNKFVVRAFEVVVATMLPLVDPGALYF